MTKMTSTVGQILVIITIITLSILPQTSAIRWHHSAQLDDNFRLLWNLHADSITIELQVRTHGYVGIGFARSTAPIDGADNRDGADMIVGWVDRGQTYLQDRHYKFNGAAEPRVDPSDDLQLLLGYENATHTVLRFQRALDTCDSQHDVAITNSTMRVAFMYHAGEPRWGGIGPGALPQPNLAFRGIVPLQIAQRRHVGEHRRRPTSLDDEEEVEVVQVLELRNEEVPLPVFGESLRWCRVFELTDFKRKHHMIRYEPLFGTAKGGQLLDQIVLYECQGSSLRLSAMARDNGRICGGSDPNAGGSHASARHSRSSVPCNAIVASWTRGSSGLVFPPEAGIPLDSHKERFYLMESHYSNVDAGHVPDDLLDDLYAGPLLDDSGLRLHVTAQLRQHDAGVLSVGIAADWKHIIPPAQERFTAEGQCVDACTRNTLPPTGLSVFALLMRTGSLGQAMRLRQIRGGSEELLPLATDAAVHADYAEYRHLEPAARVLPGDRLVVECTYDSTERDTITVGADGGGGGHRRGARGAAGCNVLAVYYPRQKRLTECESLPSLPTVLQSLGIEQLSGNPVRIAAPAALAGMTLESRLLGYDWAQWAAEFERVTRAGSFQAVCRDARHKTVLGTDRRMYRPATVRRIWREPTQRRQGGKCAQREQQWGEFGAANEVDEVAMSNSVDGEPDEHDAYVVQSMGLSGGAWKDVRPVPLVVVVLLASVCALVGR